MIKVQDNCIDPEFMQPCPSWAYKFKIIAYGAWTPEPKKYNFAIIEAEE